MEKIGLICGGTFLIIIAVIAYQIPLDVTIVGAQYSITIPEGVALCDARIYPFDEMPPDAARFCAEFRTAFMGIYGAGALGAILIIISAVINGKRKNA